MGGIERFILNVIHAFKMDVEDYCDIETSIGKEIIVYNDGSLGTIIKFNGLKSLISVDQYEEMISRLASTFGPYLGNTGYQIQIVFYRDTTPDALISKIGEAQEHTARVLNLDVGDLVKENTNIYKQYVYAEDCYFVLWSKPSLLNTEEEKKEAEKRMELRHALNGASMPSAQSVFRASAFLTSKHRSFTATILRELQSEEMNCDIEVLNVQSAFSTIRSRLYQDMDSSSWSCSIPGDQPPPIRWKENSDPNDYSELYYPPIPQQIMSYGAQIGGDPQSPISDPCTVRVGNRVYAPLILTIPPRDPKPFDRLFNIMNTVEVIENGERRACPWSLSIMLEGDGMNGMKLKNVLCTFLKMTSHQNKLVASSFERLSHLSHEGNVIAKLRMSAMTWVNADSEGLQNLNLRKRGLNDAIQQWGNPAVSEKSGNPMLAFQSNILGLSLKHIGTPAAAPLDEALRFLPITRPASPFSEGSIINRTLDGKIMPYQRFSSLQTTWITLISGKPGSGKSVLMNNNNVESCLMPGLTKLPYICMIDIGVSSSGFIDLIRDSIDDDRKYLLLYKRLQNSTDDAINPFDTFLGFRKPIQRQFDNLKEFITQLVTPAEREMPYVNMTDFVARVINYTYDRKSDQSENSTPFLYRKGHNDIIDNAVKQFAPNADHQTPYWKLVDIFFKNDALHAAEVAQRYAVPVLNDLVESASHLHDEYADIKTDDGTPIVSAFIVGARNAASAFPIFSSYTNFDVGSARIISLDLQDVATVDPTPAAKKKTSLMYMMARECFMKKISFHKENIKEAPSVYKEYYKKVAEELVDDLKVLCMDEYHTTGGSPSLSSQIRNDGRVARKLNLEIILASQLPTDFGEITDIATSIFILDAGTPKIREWMRKNINLSQEEEVALTKYVHGPTPHGMTYLAKFSTKQKNYNQLFTMVVGPNRLWALSTTAEDMRLRNYLYERMPKSTARRLLSEFFPKGSCKSFIEKEKLLRVNSQNLSGDDFSKAIVEEIGEQIYQKYRNTPELYYS